MPVRLVRLVGMSDRGILGVVHRLLCQVPWLLHKGCRTNSAARAGTIAFGA